MTTKEYYWKNREKVREYNRKWYAENQEEERRKSRKYKKENGEVRRRWQKANRDKCVVISWSGNHKEEIYKLKGGKCEECGSKENLHMHHLEYIKSFDVLKLLCRPCHINTHVKLRTYEKPLTSPT